MNEPPDEGGRERMEHFCGDEHGDEGGVGREKRKWISDDDVIGGTCSVMNSLMRVGERRSMSLKVDLSSMHMILIIMRRRRVSEHLWVDGPEEDLCGQEGDFDDGMEL